MKLLKWSKIQKNGVITILDYFGNWNDFTMSHKANRALIFDLLSIINKWKETLDI